MGGHTVRSYPTVFTSALTIEFTTKITTAFTNFNFRVGIRDDVPRPKPLGGHTVPSYLSKCARSSSCLGVQGLRSRNSDEKAPGYQFLNRESLTLKLVPPTLTLKIEALGRAQSPIVSVEMCSEFLLRQGLWLRCQVLGFCLQVTNPTTLFPLHFGAAFACDTFGPMLDGKRIKLKPFWQ